MFLIVGLGNPGAEYEKTRHNIGFRVVDALEREAGAGSSRVRFSGLASEGSIAGEKVLLLKPQTYMNLSGRSVQEAARFYQLTPERVLVIHDELDLPFGDLRLKQGGGVAGHNGLKSLVQCLASPEFVRLRMGIGRPPGQMKTHDFVLSGFSAAEQSELELVVREAADAVVSVLREGLVPTMNRVNAARKKPERR